MQVTNKVLEELQEVIIKQHYNNSIHSYSSITRTIELIKRNYKFANIKDKVTFFITKYTDY
jgi:hypothetical protein